MNVTEKEINTYKALDKVIEKEVIRIFNIFNKKNEYRYISFFMKNDIIVLFNDVWDEYENMIHYLVFSIECLNYINKKLIEIKNRSNESYFQCPLKNCNGKIEIDREYIDSTNCIHFYGNCNKCKIGFSCYNENIFQIIQ